MGTFTDNPSFWPILEVLNDTGAFLLIQTGLRRVGHVVQQSSSP
jgi:hypothetical protein